MEAGSTRNQRVTIFVETAFISRSEMATIEGITIFVESAFISRSEMATIVRSVKVELRWDDYSPQKLHTCFNIR